MTERSAWGAPAGERVALARKVIEWRAKLREIQDTYVLHQVELPIRFRLEDLREEGG